MTYTEFLETKIETAPASGFDVDPAALNPALKPHQRDAVAWALRGGRRALFESFGLGKTVQELEFCCQVIKHTVGSALIVLPLGVRQEFTHDAVELLGIAPPRYITSMEEVFPFGVIYMTNYERVRDGDIDPKFFSCCVLDEAAVLRSFGSKTYQPFLPKFKGVKYKLVATATPAPNRLKELIHYAGFLEIMDTGQALTRFFQRDSTKANNLTLYPHKEEEFWLWVSSWALYISKPSDLSYDDSGYDLPPMEVRTHVIADSNGENADRDGQYKLLNDAATSLMEASKEKKQSITARCAKAKEIVESDPDAHFLLWHDLEAERHELKRILPEAVDIYGSMDYDEREKRVNDFSFGRTRLFATKKSLSGCGCNFQRYCHRAIFVGVDYEFHDFIQAVHRIYRFLQSERVIIDVIYTEAEEPIWKAMLEKWKLHDEQQERMGEIVKKYDLSGQVQIEKLKRSIGVERVEIKGERFTAINNDCVDETARMKENSDDEVFGNKDALSSYLGYLPTPKLNAIAEDGTPYGIGSDRGTDFARNAAAGATITGGDGSTWIKNADGSVTITDTGWKQYTLPAEQASAWTSSLQQMQRDGIKDVAGAIDWLLRSGMFSKYEDAQNYALMYVAPWIREQGAGEQVTIPGTTPQTILWQQMTSGAAGASGGGTDYSAYLPAAKTTRTAGTDGAMDCVKSTLGNMAANGANWSELLSAIHDAQDMGIVGTDGSPA